MHAGKNPRSAMPFCSSGFILRFCRGSVCRIWAGPNHLGFLGKSAALERNGPNHLGSWVLFFQNRVFEGATPSCVGNICTVSEIPEGGIISYVRHFTLFM